MLSIILFILCFFQGMQQLRASAVKPRVKPWLEPFAASHDIGEEEFADFEANDPFVQNLILNLDSTFFSRGIFRRRYHYRLCCASSSRLMIHLC